MATQSSASFEKLQSGVERLTTNASSNKGPFVCTDSGYASAESTPDHKSSEAGSYELGHRSSRQPFSKSKKTKLRPFDQEISQAVQDRFSDLTELFGPSLYSFLVERRVKYNAISIKLKVLGEDERSAKPWVVVQCDEAASKPIRNFFDQKDVKSQYRSGDSEPDLPSFDVIIHPRAPLILSTCQRAKVYGNSWAGAETLCGKVIKTGTLNEPHIATLGGVIDIEMSPGEFFLYGLTAGHILAKVPAIEHGNERESPSSSWYAARSSCEIAPTDLEPENQKVEDGLVHDVGDSQEHEDGESAVDYELDEEEFEIDLPVEIGKASGGPTGFQDSPLDNLHDVGDPQEQEDGESAVGYELDEDEFEIDLLRNIDKASEGLTGAQDSSLDITSQGCQEQSWSKIGTVYRASRDVGPIHDWKSQPDQDWALINITPDLYRPNLLAGQPDVELTELSGEVDKSEGSRAVVLASDIGGLKHGTLSFSPSFLMLGQAKTFTKTYNLRLHGVSGTIATQGLRTVHILC